MHLVAVEVEPVQRARRLSSVDELNLAVVARRRRRHPLAPAADDGVRPQPPPRGEGRLHLEHAVRAADPDLGGDLSRLADRGVGVVADFSRPRLVRPRLVRPRRGLPRLLRHRAAEHLHHLRQVDLAVLAERGVVQLDEERAVLRRRRG